MKICESKNAAYQTILAFLLSIPIMYLFTLLISDDLLNEELRKDHIFSDDKKFC